MSDIKKDIGIVHHFVVKKQESGIVLENQRELNQKKIEIDKHVHALENEVARCNRVIQVLDQKIEELTEAIPQYKKRLTDAQSKEMPEMVMDQIKGVVFQLEHDLSDAKENVKRFEEKRKQQEKIIAQVESDKNVIDIDALAIQVKFSNFIEEDKKNALKKAQEKAKEMGYRTIKLYNESTTSYEYILTDYRRG